MTIIICAITAGILLGWLDVFNYKTKLWLNRVSTVCLFIILLCLGAKIGCDKEMLAKIPVLGHTDGICHIFVDETADLEMAKKII